MTIDTLTVLAQAEKSFSGNAWAIIWLGVAAIAVLFLF